MTTEHYAKIRCRNCRFICTIDGYTANGDTIEGLRQNIKRQARACNDEAVAIVEAYVWEGQIKRTIDMRL